MMNIESIREYMLSLPEVTEDSPFEPDGLAFRVENKIFAYIGLYMHNIFTLKCNPEVAIRLRERYSAIAGAWHWNKKYWNQIELGAGVPDELIRQMIVHAYAEVVRKLPRKTRDAHPDIVQAMSTDTLIDL